MSAPKTNVMTMAESYRKYRYDSGYEAARVIYAEKIAALEAQLAEAMSLGLYRQGTALRNSWQCKVEALEAQNRTLRERVLNVRGTGSHNDCSDDYYFGSEDRGDNRCDLCKLKDEIRAALAATEPKEKGA